MATMAEGTNPKDPTTMAEDNKSVGWVAVMLALAVAYFGWAFMASDYFQNDPTAGSGEANFWVNSIQQLSHLPSVIRYTVQNRFWILGTVVGLEIGVVIFYGIMKKMERELWGK